MRGLFHASRTLGVPLVVVAIIGYCGIGWGALYQCRDALGAEVLTDSPTSSEQCKPVKGVSSLGAPPQELRTPPGGATLRRSRQPRHERRPSPAQPVPPVEDEFDAQFGDGSPNPTPRRPSVPARSARPEESPTMPKRCGSPVNPLNPLQSVPCPPEGPPPPK